MKLGRITVTEKKTNRNVVKVVEQEIGYDEDAASLVDHSLLEDINGGQNGKTPTAMVSKQRFQTYYNAYARRKLYSIYI